MGAGALLVLALGGRALAADCLEAYATAKDRRRAAAIGGATWAAVAVSAVVVSPIVVFPIVPIATDEAGNIAMVAMTFSGVAFTTGAGLGGASTLRYASVDRVYDVLVDASVGDGPALRAYSADLSVDFPTGAGPAELAALIQEYNTKQDFCWNGPMGFREFDRRVRFLLEQGSDTPGAPPPEGAAGGPPGSPQ